MLEVTVLSDVTTLMEVAPDGEAAVAPVALGLEAAPRWGGSDVVVVCPTRWASAVLGDPV